MTVQWLGYLGVSWEVSEPGLEYLASLGFWFLNSDCDYTRC